MPCATTHRLINFTATAVFLAAQERGSSQHPVRHPLLGATLSATLSTLPDLIEPAIHPHHRQFFHSLTFAALVGYGVYKAYRWEPQTPSQELLRLLAIIGGSAYLLHLIADFTTARSLPLLGR
jgi:inner membrane protein